jgi:transposase InsO family protein
VEDEIIALRKQLDRGGHEAGAATIAAHLQQRHGPDAVPAVSTIWRILSARGFVTPQPHKRPRSSIIRFAAEQPNERWQLDITHYRLADNPDHGGTDVEVLNVLDDHSRLCLASTARRVFTAGEVNTVFTAATSEYGDPASLLSDNGAVFTGTPRRGGRVALELTCWARGIRFTHSRPYHPQTCGKVERFHQTLKKWLDRQPRPATVRQLQALLDHFRAYYNQIRPHRALGRRTPAQAYTARPQAVPTGAPIDTGHYRVRHDRIDSGGLITLRHNSRLHHIGIGRRHARTRVLVLVRDLHIRVLNTDGELLRELTLDPTRDYQPQAQP